MSIIGLEHYSPSALNLFAPSPSMFVLERVIGLKQPVAVPAHRGTAIEDGVTLGLMKPDEPLQNCINVALARYDFLTAMSTDERREKYRATIPDMVNQALIELRAYDVPSATQGYVEWRPEGLNRPIVGYFDFYWEQHNITTDLKTTERMPSEVKVNHARQVSLYVTGNNADPRVTYCTPRKCQTYNVENINEHRKAASDRTARRKVSVAVGRSRIFQDDHGAGSRVLLLDQTGRAAAGLRPLENLKFPINPGWRAASRSQHLGDDTMTINAFGFSTEPSTAVDFTPICKYDARSGRIFRVDRLATSNGFESTQVDITAIFKAMVDFENVETGFIDFPVGSAPSFVLIKFADLKGGKQLPDRPSKKHKNGIRFLLKLHKTCGGDKPVREMAGTAKVFVNGVYEVFQDYEKEKAKYPGKLPVITLAGTSAVKSGKGSNRLNELSASLQDRWMGHEARGPHPYPGGRGAAGGGAGYCAIHRIDSGAASGSGRFWLVR